MYNGFIATLKLWYLNKSAPFLWRVLIYLWNNLSSNTLDSLSDIRPQTTSSWYVLVPKTCPKFGNPPYLTSGLFLGLLSLFYQVGLLSLFYQVQVQACLLRPQRVWWNPSHLFTIQNNSSLHFRLVLGRTRRHMIYQDALHDTESVAFAALAIETVN